MINDDTSYYDLSDAEFLDRLEDLQPLPAELEPADLPTCYWCGDVLVDGDWAPYCCSSCAVEAEMDR